jgi:hypothetical protein
VKVLQSITTSSGLVTAASGASIAIEVPSGTKNGTNNVFTLANTPLLGTLQLFTNGLLLSVGNDFLLSATTIIFLSGAVPQASDGIQASYYY